jgi:hypothetical protein
VRLSAADAGGNATSWQMPVVVYPELRPSISVQGRADRSFSFTAGAGGGDGALLAGHWTFADGTTADGLSVVHRFASGVSPAATLTVVDGTGSSATTSWPPGSATAPRYAGGLASSAAAVADSASSGGVGNHAPLPALAASASRPAVQRASSAASAAQPDLPAPLAAALMAALLLARRLLARRRRRPNAAQVARP